MAKKSKKNPTLFISIVEDGSKQFYVFEGGTNAPANKNYLVADDYGHVIKTFAVDVKLPVLKKATTSKLPMIDLSSIEVA